MSPTVRYRLKRAKFLTLTSPFLLIVCIKGFGDIIIRAFDFLFYLPCFTEMKKISVLIFLLMALATAGYTQTEVEDDSAKAEDIVAKAVALLGGNRYLNIRTQVGKGKFSVIREGTVISFQSFVDVIVYPDNERTDFKGNGSKTVQVNTGDSGWVYDGDQELIKDQNESQIANFRQSIRTSLDSLLRGEWKGNAELTYVGRRAATLGKRNDVVKLTYNDGFAVEFEFAVDDALPQKAIYKRTNADAEEITEEDRYAQFIEIKGIRSPFIVDRFTNGKPSSRINYESIEFNKSIPESIFAKPSNPKDARKDIKM